MDPNADVVRAAIICSAHLNVWPVPEICSGDMVTCILKTKKHGNIYVVSLYCDGEKQPIPDMLKTLHGTLLKDGKRFVRQGYFKFPAELHTTRPVSKTSIPQPET